MAHQANFPPYGYPQPYGNGHANLAKSYVPTMIMILVVGFAISATYAATNWLNTQEAEKKTIGQRVDGLHGEVRELRQDVAGVKASQSRIEQAIKELPRGNWAAEVRR